MIATTDNLYWHASGIIFARAGRTPVQLTSRLGGVERAEDLAVFFDELSAPMDDGDPAKAHVVSCSRQLRVAVRQARAYALKHHPVLKHWPTDCIVGRARDEGLRP